MSKSLFAEDLHQWRLDGFRPMPGGVDRENCLEFLRTHAEFGQEFRYCGCRSLIESPTTKKRISIFTWSPTRPIISQTPRPSFVFPEIEIEFAIENRVCRPSAIVDFNLPNGQISHDQFRKNPITGRSIDCSPHFAYRKCIRWESAIKLKKEKKDITTKRKYI